jgi:hypothetical protein
MTVRVMTERCQAALRRLGWLLIVALPTIVAACGKGGTSAY